jgi:DNA-binding transcriptional LysR family regulator
MELRHLRYFVAIAEEQSFTRAAERLWVAQPGLSTQIRKLEEELGARVFERHTRGVDLTPAGELLLERARAALAAADLAGATGEHIATGVTGRIRLGLATGQSWHCAAAVLERFALAHPAIRMSVLEGHGGTLWRDLRDGRLDAVLAPARFASPDLSSLALGAEPWLVLAGAAHPLAGSGPLPAAALDGERIAVVANGEGGSDERDTAELLDGLGVCATFMPTAPGPALHAAVARGDALSLTTAPLVLAPGVVARELAGAPRLEFALLWRERVSPPALAPFIETAAELAEGRPRRRASLRAVA